MTCIYCTTSLPVDHNTDTITCPKCGSELVVKKLIKAWGFEQLTLESKEDEPTKNNQS